MTLVGEGKKYPFTLTVNGLEPNREYWSKHFPEISSETIPDCEDVRVTPRGPYVQMAGRALRREGSDMYFVDNKPATAKEFWDAMDGRVEVKSYADGGYVPNRVGAPIILGPSESFLPRDVVESGRAALHSINETEDQTKLAVVGCSLRRYARVACNAFRDELDDLWPLARFAIMYGSSAVALYWIVVAVSWLGGVN